MSSLSNKFSEPNTHDEDQIVQKFRNPVKDKKASIIQKQSLSKILRRYKPQIIESYAMEKKQILNSQYSQNNQSTSIFQHKEQAISQKDIYIIQENPIKSKIKSKKQRLLTQDICKVGIKADLHSSQNRKIPLHKRENKQIRTEKKINLKSIIQKNRTEPNDNAELIQQTEETISKVQALNKNTKIGSNQNSLKIRKEKILPQADRTHLPNLQKAKSTSVFINKRAQSQSSSPQISLKVFRKKLKTRQSQSHKHSKSSFKSPSYKRLHQDYNYLLQKDDSERYHQRSKPLLNEQKKKVKFLKEKQEMLGKIVLERVHKHLDQEKRQQVNYITKINSEKTIDDALIEFLKTKVKRADKALNQ